jgi:hypothetical protein
VNFVRPAATRSASEVFEGHLKLRLDEDLARNYAPDVVLLTVNSSGGGHDAVCMSARRLSEQLPDARFGCAGKQVNDRFALLILAGLLGSLRRSRWQRRLRDRGRPPQNADHRLQADVDRRSPPEPVGLG